MTTPPLPRKPRRKLKYSVTVKDEGITVCVIRFNNEDAANFVGTILSMLLGQISAVDTDAMHMQYPPFTFGEDDEATENL